MLQNVIVEGLDRLGKSTLIEGLQQRLGFFNVIHYQKPKLLNTYVMSVGNEHARREFQRESFAQMFKLLGSDARFILDRAHLGEAVYAHRYRGYDGSYVFELESMANAEALNNTLLVLLTNQDPVLESRLVDDGESFDWSKREAEAADFKQAFDRSKFRHKALVNVGHGSDNNRVGQFIDADYLARRIADLVKQPAPHVVAVNAR